jgi:hypothetical protein
MSPDLRTREAWAQAVSPKTGEKITDVIESTCKRYTICRNLIGKLERELFLVWRRRPKWQAPDLIGGYPTAEAARDACQRHADKNP